MGQRRGENRALADSTKGEQPKEASRTMPKTITRPVLQHVARQDDPPRVAPRVRAPRAATRS